MVIPATAMSISPFTRSPMTPLQAPVALSLNEFPCVTKGSNFKIMFEAYFFPYVSMPSVGSMSS